MLLLNVKNIIIKTLHKQTSEWARKSSTILARFRDQLPCFSASASAHWDRLVGYCIIIQNVRLWGSNLPCWVLVGVKDFLKKKRKCVFWSIKPPYSTFSLTQDYLGKSILFLANGWAHQNSFPACDELPLLDFKKSHSDPQW